MNTRGNILLVANWPSDVGYAWWLMENFWVAIAEHFSTQGMTTYLAYPSINTVPDRIASSCIELLELDFQDRGMKNQQRLRELIHDKSLRYIYLSDSSFYDLYYLSLRWWGIRKIVVHDHTPGDRTPARGSRRILKSLIQRLPWYTADHFIAVTPFVHQRFLEVSCIPRRKCSIANNGIIPINLDTADMTYTQRVFGIADDAVIVVSVSRASYYKGIDLMLRVAHRLIVEQGRNELVFLFCGDGPDLKDFYSLAEKLELGDHMIFAGNRKDVRAILPSCDIGFHASTGEVGYSLSTLEYMSAGLATVVPDRPSTRQATINGETGLLYEPGNIDSAAAAILQAMQPAIAGSIGQHAIVEIKQNFEIGRTNESLLGSLQDIFC